MIKRLAQADPKDIQKTLYRLANEGRINTEGSNKNRTYMFVSKKNK